MQTTIEYQLPGVYFQVESPEPEAVLPRMDIGAFVGLASSGPLHTPVPIEDVAHFRDIFGDDLPLAWDPEAGKKQYAYLAPAVESFFRNGGRRCWVVRVAGKAQVNHFPLPGLVQAKNWQPAVARARSEGSWSDTLRTGTVQLSQTLPVAGYAGSTSSYQVDLATAPGLVGKGDLLRLRFGSDGPQLYIVVTATTAAPSGGVRQATSSGEKNNKWFLSKLVADPLPAPVSARLLTPGQEESLPVLQVRYEDGFHKVWLDLELKDAPQPGELVRVDFAAPSSEGAQTLLLPVEQTLATAGESSPPEQFVEIRGQQGVWPVSESDGLAQAEAWLSGGSPPEDRQPAIERLAFELWVWRGQENYARLGELAFASDHARFWGGLPVDAELYHQIHDDDLLKHNERSGKKLSALAAETIDPRFPLAGPVEAAEWYLPLGMPGLPDLESSQPPLATAPGTALERDGIKNFSADLFLDPDVGPAGTATQRAEANNKRYIRHRRLIGLHSLFNLDEITLIAVPDAIQRGWEEVVTAPPRPLPAPVLDAIDPPEDMEAYDVSWSQVAEATSYELQEANEATFDLATSRYEGQATGQQLAVPETCPQFLYYRVRAKVGGQVSPWSNTQMIRVPQPDFKDCQEIILDGPILQQLLPASPPEDGYDVSWTPVAEATTYTLEEAADPTFTAPTVLYSGVATTNRVWRRDDGVYFFRVRAEHDDQVGPWSNTRWVEPDSRQGWAIKKAGLYGDGDLLAVQRALIRFCAARADILALLTLPAHYREDEALAHVEALLAQTESEDASAAGGDVTVRPISHGEGPVHSYAALFHPWVMTRFEDAAGVAVIRKIPPDGPICGAMAARAIKRGAWVAPANEALAGIVALDPAIDRPGWARLFAEQINLVRQDPRGFMLLSAETLSPDTLLQPINVRRLLILLRRLAIREGMTYVFAPNNEAFWRLVRHRFEQLLAYLYARGAFAGSTPDQAFRVVTDRSLNTQASIDQGRFIVELRVAPSRPLTFLTVRLVQTDRQGLAVQEVS